MDKSELLISRYCSVLFSVRKRRTANKKHAPFSFTARDLTNQFHLSSLWALQIPDLVHLAGLVGWFIVPPKPNKKYPVFWNCAVAVWDFDYIYGCLELSQLPIDYCWSPVIWLHDFHNPYNKSPIRFTDSQAPEMYSNEWCVAENRKQRELRQFEE